MLLLVIARYFFSELQKQRTKESLILLGVSAPLLCKAFIACFCAYLQAKRYKLVYAFTRPGDGISEAFALKMGAAWAGSSLEPPPVKLDAAIIFAPDGSLVPIALSHLDKGGTVVCGGILMGREIEWSCCVDSMIF